jgi:hypothetical protein
MSQAVFPVLFFEDTYIPWFETAPPSDNQKMSEFVVLDYIVSPSLAELVLVATANTVHGNFNRNLTVA